MTKKQFITWPQLEGYCMEIAKQVMLSKWTPDIIVGITRGGAIPAVMLSQFLEVKMVGLDVSLRDSQNRPETNCWLAEDAAAGRNILIVDDINDSGATINWIMDDWASSVAGLDRGIEWGYNVRVATIVDNDSSDAKLHPKYCGTTINKANEDRWVVFPWEDFWKK